MTIFVDLVVVEIADAWTRLVSDMVENVVENMVEVPF